MLTAEEILSKYWGYPSFRKNQEKIINSVIQGKDTLALLPTSGGKSICYQIPSLMMEGICIVVSPLISLMHDQLQELRKRNIKAISIDSGLTFEEINTQLTNCVFGNYKFLYISPEKLQNEFIKEKIMEMNVNLLAIDEAHCISEWGHNFRPSYRNISSMRDYIKDAPILALTATATDQVANDIQNNLKFYQKNKIQSSFIRDNLSYILIKENNKKKKLIEILNKIDGSSIIYVNSRNQAEQIDIFLKEENIKSEFYHAGISIKERNKRQLSWQLGRTKTIVATNAFGMGINKKDVRMVIHLAIPYNIESYFQEVGRSGRDKNESFAISLYNDNDIKKVNNLQRLFPSKFEIEEFYTKLANHLQVPINSGRSESFRFNLIYFIKKYNLNKFKTKKIIDYLAKKEFLELNNIILKQSRIQIKITNQELNKFLKSNKYYNPLIKLLLRSYSGIFEKYININELIFEVKLGLKEQEIIKQIKRLEKLEVLKYIPKGKYCEVKYLHNRKDIKYLNIHDQEIKNWGEFEKNRIKSIKEYYENESSCRQKILVSYFGEKIKIDCNKCDICRKRNNLKKNI